MTQSIQEQGVTFPAIKAECHFVEVGSQMLWANPMPTTNDAALEKRKCGFNRVGCDTETVFVSDVFVGAVIHSLALRYLGLGKARRVQDGFIGNDHVYIFADVFGHDFADRLSCRVFYVDEFQSAAALDDPDNHFLALDRKSVV